MATLAPELAGAEGSELTGGGAPEWSGADGRFRSDFAPEWSGADGRILSASKQAPAPLTTTAKVTGLQQHRPVEVVQEDSVTRGER